MIPAQTVTRTQRRRGEQASSVAAEFDIETSLAFALVTPDIGAVAHVWSERRARVIRNSRTRRRPGASVIDLRCEPIHLVVCIEGFNPTGVLSVNLITVIIESPRSGEATHFRIRRLLKSLHGL